MIIAILTGLVYFLAKVARPLLEFGLEVFVAIQVARLLKAHVDAQVAANRSIE